MKAKESLTDQAYKAIKQMILNHDVLPGDHMSENNIANELKMSRTPVREALKMLAHEGFIDIHNGVGIFVKTFTAKEVLDFFKLRIVLENFALQEFLLNVQDSELDKMEDQWNELKKYDKDKKDFYVEARKLDRDFHRQIINKTRNNSLIEIMGNISEKMNYYQMISIKTENIGDELVQEHLDLIEVFRERNVEKAKSFLTKQLNNAAEKFIHHKEWIA